VSFKSVLEKMVRRLGGVLGAVVIGEDGIIVERHVVDPNFDTELAGVEYVGSCKDIRRATESLESGEVQEVAVVTEKTRMVLRSISPGYYIILVMSPEGSLGRGRFELKKASYDLAPEFL
jgi:predicted regulator of Ras-like GTPase activity (Roadblock/LC7/MglB family)